MERRFFKRKEVASFLRISERTLTNYAGKHAVYRAEGGGVYHIDHVKILEKVWAKAISRDEGLALWEFEKMRMRGTIEKITSNRKGQKANPKSHLKS